MDVFLPVPYSALFKLRGEIYIIVLFYFLFGFTSGAQVTHFTFNDTLTHTLKHAYSNKNKKEIRKYGNKLPY